MTTQIEAMKLALEALECTEYPQDHYDAITALREAMAEQPAQQPDVADEMHDIGNDRATPSADNIVNALVWASGVSRPTVIRWLVERADEFKTLHESQK